MEAGSTGSTTLDKHSLDWSSSTAAAATAGASTKASTEASTEASTAPQTVADERAVTAVFGAALPGSSNGISEGETASYGNKNTHKSSLSVDSPVAASTAATAAVAEPIRTPALVAALNGEQWAGQGRGGVSANGKSVSGPRNGSGMSTRGSPKPMVYGERTFDRPLGGSGATMGFSNEGSRGNPHDSNARFVC